jgi:hypothetical protein
VGPNGNSLTFSGICSSVRNYLTAHHINTDLYPLHWDPSNEQKRRTQTCDGDDRNPCSGPDGEDERAKTTLGIAMKPRILTWDEFPFASSEEGGRGWDTPLGIAAVHPAKPLGATRTCVPQWQNSAQGVCNGIATCAEPPSLARRTNAEVGSLSTIMTNVEYHNDADNPNPNNTQRYPWLLETWNRAGKFKGDANPGRRRLTLYPARRPYRINGQEQNNDCVDWYHKRNLTLFFVNNEISRKASFPGNDFSNGEFGMARGGVRPVTNTITNAAWIVCAVSLRGQARYEFARAYNGYCWDGMTLSPTTGGHFQ